MNIINTFKCNFTCKHCCFNSSPRFKLMMPDHIFMEAIKQFGDDFIHIVGGEPFLHPRIFWQLKFSLWQNYSQTSIVTNGSWILTPSGNLTSKFREFINLQEEADMSNLFIHISEDEFHAPFQHHSVDTLINTIKIHTSANADKYTRGHNNFIIPIGRAKRNNLGNTTIRPSTFNEGYESTPECLDSFDTTILPNGDISICCNARNIIGNITQNEDWNLLYRKTRYVLSTKCRISTSKDCAKCKYFSPIHALSEAELKKSDYEQLRII